MAKLRTYVHVKDDKGLTHVFGPDDVVPDWAEAIITNPKAWAEAPVSRLAEPAPGPAPAKKAAAKRTPARRKAAGDALPPG
ncbi:hypothetical protein ACFRCI_23350 [Streptomyces sp. NPDC056638]|uniref:hypothetical protein n=1 Tax=Streptomyces sp. NPDC056638 TaxID=3345887 RepID=UPI0036750257